MILEKITADRRSFTAELGPRCPDHLAQLHWTVIQSVGLRPQDVVYAPIELAVFQTISTRAGFERAKREEKASVIFLYRPEESELLGIASKLEEGRRLIAYNDLSQVDALSLKSFQNVTACLFDHDSKKVVRIYDGGEQPRVSEYIHVEINDHTDSALSVYASRIASLR
jgi:hypothetical protein